MPPKPAVVEPATPVAAAPSSSSSAYPEWTIAMPSAGSELHDAVELAIGHAQNIVGRKYRYGAILLAGDDHIPIKSGSNKKEFKRENIHAEMSVLKGCARPAGKDMLIARLAPSKAASGRGGGKGGGKREYDSDDEEEEEDEDDDLLRDCAPAAASGPGKVLNARPCAKCEAKMVARGARPHR